MFNFIMGNEESRTSNVDFDSDAVEVTDNWTLCYAHNYNGSTTVRSAFISPQGTSDSSSNNLKRLAKNLMIHRHPCIIQYISSWSKNDSFYLITEEVRPLAQVIGNQSALQICIGLHSILRALTFLHEKALSSHNNLCCASIYVTPEGVWKLGGLDYLRKFSDVTTSFLQESRAHRYEKAVPPEEDSLVPKAKVNAEAVDQYAFGVFVEEVLKKKTNDEIPYLLDFKAYCKKGLHSIDPSQRCKLSDIMSHQFFNHDFIRIHKFLSELPLKLCQEKEEFFRDLTVQLSMLPEEIVASQLASLLLSRMVILDEAAQQHLLPVILQPKTGNGREGKALFSGETFKRHIVPKLLQMFCVRDAQVRLILLSHFNLFCGLFTAEQLKHQVLPELLIGIKDVNDELVSTTLKALADLVLILGASTVIGGKRAKLFTDGRPKALDSASVNRGKLKGKDKESPDKVNLVYESSELPERLSPDGGEDDMSTTTVGEPEIDNENWSDWDSPLLIGIKDVNDELVSTTLKALADLVLILGASTVIGGKRAKLFTDGRPKALDSASVNRGKLKGKDKESPDKVNLVYESSELPERLSPDGGEDDMSTTTVGEPEIDNENWSDWDSPGEKETIESEGNLMEKEPEIVSIAREKSSENMKNGNQQNQPTLPDISMLDIKCNISNGKSEGCREEESEIDFFRDMEPVIIKTNSLDINLSKNKFDINLDADDVGGGWDEGEEWALGEETES